MKTILIGGAWPYANGALHIGHIASLLPGDVLARYYRLKGDNVYYVSGSDCYGTPVAIRAKAEGKTPREISDFYHKEFAEVFSKLGFSYDVYGKTSDESHIQFVTDFHQKLYESPYIYEKQTLQAYCSHCGKARTDRLVTGLCPVCGEAARGDQCDCCGTVLESETLLSPVCAECGSPIVFHDTTQLYIAISKLENTLRTYLSSHPNWRKNAIAFTRRYIDEGLRDRAVTRDLDWGIDVSKKGYEKKKIYIWAENVLGYLSQSKVAAEKRGGSFEEIWGENARHYYVHGKDNIPFHSIILPSLLIAHGSGWRLPDDFISSEHLTLEGRKISTSRNWLIAAKDITESYNPDAIRYYFIAGGPEKRDTDFSWHEFMERNNSELLGVYGNFVNRTLAFIARYQNSIIPNGTFSPLLLHATEQAYQLAGLKIENGCFKEALEDIWNLARQSNKYFDAEEPWKTRLTDHAKCRNTLFNCVQLIVNLAVLLTPFLPFSSEKVLSWLDGSNTCREWKIHTVSPGIRIPTISILFERLDKGIIQKELDKLYEI